VKPSWSSPRAARAIGRQQVMGKVGRANANEPLMTSRYNSAASDGDAGGGSRTWRGRVPCDSPALGARRRTPQVPGLRGSPPRPRLGGAERGNPVGVRPRPVSRRQRRPKSPAGTGWSEKRMPMGRKPRGNPDGRPQPSGITRRIRDWCPARKGAYADQVDLWSEAARKPEPMDKLDAGGGCDSEASRIGVSRSGERT
jgi:hypothetical protein